MRYVTNRLAYLGPSGGSGAPPVPTGERYSVQWYARLYEGLGEGVTCFRPTIDDPDYGGGVLTACRCCRPGIRLHLLPGEEAMFTDVVDPWSFQLNNHPTIPGRKTITCYKLGQCNGRKPFVCRTHPVYFSRGHMLFEEDLCRMTCVKFLSHHGAAVERIRSIVRKFGLDDTVLGYGRVTSLPQSDKVSLDYQH
jgi:hypothetical protein